MYHGFDIGVAKKYGIRAAVLLEYIAHWVVYNNSLNQNFIDGRFWTYNTNLAMQEQFPYLTKRQIEYTIKQLKEDGLIEVRNLNADKMNHTNWFTLTEKGSAEISRTIVQTCAFDSTEVCNDKDLLHYNITNSIHLIHNPPLSPQAQNCSIEKITYADDVTLTEEEHKKLVDRFSEQGAKELIDILSNYKGSSGKKYKSDYKTILGWVLRQWKQDHRESRPVSKSFKQQEHEDFMAFAEELAKKGRYVE